MTYRNIFFSNKDKTRSYSNIASFYADYVQQKRFFCRENNKKNPSFQITTKIKKYKMIPLNHVKLQIPSLRVANAL